jgi:hypothetical protein
VVRPCSLRLPACFSLWRSLPPPFLSLFVCLHPSAPASLSLSPSYSYLLFPRNPPSPRCLSLSLSLCSGCREFHKSAMRAIFSLLAFIINQRRRRRQPCTAFSPIATHQLINSPTTTNQSTTTRFSTIASQSDYILIYTNSFAISIRTHHVHTTHLPSTYAPRHHKGVDRGLFHPFLDPLF